jgi:hypothetical protein
MAHLDAVLKRRIVACKTLSALVEESQEGIEYAGAALDFVLSLNLKDWKSQPLAELERVHMSLIS